MKIFYFGCVGEAGHFWWASDSRRPNQYELPRFLDGLQVDGLFCPMLNGREEEGWAQVVYVHEPFGGRTWTLLAFWDRSVDARPGCNSLFAVEGTHIYEVAKALAMESFPAVWDRYRFIVVEWRPLMPEPRPL